MNFVKIAAATIALIGISTTAQASDFNKSPLVAKTSVHTLAPVKKAHTIRVTKKAIQLPTARNVATHATRSVLFYNPSATRTKVINSSVQSENMPNFFKH